MTTVVATPGQGPDRPQEVSYSDTKVIGNGSFGVVFQAKLCDNGELVAIKKVLQDKRFKVSWAYFYGLWKDPFNFFNILHPQNRELQIMRRLEHCNIVKLKYFFYSSGEKVSYGRHEFSIFHFSRFPFLCVTLRVLTEQKLKGESVWIFWIFSHTEVFLHTFRSNSINLSTFKFTSIDILRFFIYL